MAVSPLSYWTNCRSHEMSGTIEDDDPVAAWVVDELDEGWQEAVVPGVAVD